MKSVITEIVEDQFDDVLNAIEGITDCDYGLAHTGEDFEDNFAEALESKGIKVSDYKLKLCFKAYDKLKARKYKQFRRLYSTKEQERWAKTMFTKLRNYE